MSLTGDISSCHNYICYCHTVDRGAQVDGHITAHNTEDSAQYKIMSTLSTVVNLQSFDM